MKKIILACLLIPFMFSSVNAEEIIGTVNKVKTYAYGTRVDQGRDPLFARDEVYRNEVVETVKSGALWMIFNDDTELFIGESGRLTLDNFVYDDVNRDSLVIHLTKGVFRFISGSISSERVLISTPVATMGIRGTDVEITIDNTGAMVVTAFEGSVSVRSSSVRSSGPADMAAYTEGCQSILILKDGTILGVEPCPSGGPSIGPASFASGSGHGGGHTGRSSPSGDIGSPSGGDSEGPGEGPGNDGPSGGSGNGNGNNGNPGNGGGNINGSGPGTGNNGNNNGQGHGAGNGGGGHGNGGAK